MHTARTPPPAVAPKDHVYQYGPQPRPRPVHYSGERPPEEATRKLPQPTRPPATENPMYGAAEPYSPPVRPERKPHWRDKLEVRRVGEADIEEMMPWVMPRIQKIYPRCTVDSVMPMIRLATAGGKMALLRTDNAVGLFCAETTPWEPDINVYQIFLVSRVRADDDQSAFADASKANQFRTSLAGGLQPTAILQAAERWARAINARTFQYGQDSGEDFDAFAAKIGFDIKTQGYTKFLRE